MKDMLSGLSAGGWGLLAGWIFPAIMAVVVVAYAVLPCASLGIDVRDLDVGQQALVLFVIAVAIGLVLNTIQTPLFRFLEGYAWPRRAREWGIERHQARRNDLLRESSTARGVEYGLLLERLHRYPSDQAQVAPTRLGNAIRALEAYGWDRYRLDSQTMWSELVSVAPASLRDEIERARAPVDFCVASLYLSLMMASGLTALAVTESLIWFVGVAGALVLAVLWYGLAVTGAGYWYATVQALVNLGRLPLAEALGLRLPADIERERDMWERVASFTRREYTADRGARLTSFRQGTDGDIESWAGHLADALRRLRA